MTTELAPITAARVERFACASREEWLKKRHEIGFGASEAATFFGHGWQGKTALAAIMDKVGPVTVSEPTEKHEIALALEDTIARLYGNKTGHHHQYTPRHEIFRRADSPHIFATPDCVLTEGGPEGLFWRLVQFKTDSRTPEAWEEQIPLPYAIQAQQEMYAADIPVEDFAVLFYGERDLAFRVYTCEANPAFQQILVARLTSAWQVVQALRRGEKAELPEPGPDDGEIVASLCAPRPAVVHQFTEDQISDIREWTEVLEHRKPYAAIASNMDSLEKRLRHRIVFGMKGAEIGVMPDGTRFKASVHERNAHEVSESKWIALKPFKERKGKQKEIESGE